LGSSSPRTRKLLPAGTLAISSPPVSCAARPLHPRAIPARFNPARQRKETARMVQAWFRIVAPEEKRDEILEVVLRLKGPTEVSTGCRKCEVLQDVEDADVLVCLEQWDTQADLEEHLRSERFRRLLPYIDMSLEPPEVHFGTIDQGRGIEFLITLLT
jgi:quinol monooxygenase YgiN